MTHRSTLSLARIAATLGALAASSIPAGAGAEPWQAVERSAAPPSGITLQITPMPNDPAESAAPEEVPAPAPEESTLACIPACRSGFTCLAGVCISACNPVCGAGEQCTADAECVARPAAVSRVPITSSPAPAPALIAAPPQPAARGWAAVPSTGTTASLETTATTPGRTGLPSRRALFPLTLPRRVFAAESGLTYVRTDAGEGDTYESLTLAQSFSWGMSDRVTLSVSPLAVSLQPEVETTGDLGIGLRGRLATGTVELALGVGLGIAPDGTSTAASIPLYLRIHLGAVAAITTGLVTYGFLQEGSDPSWGTGSPLDLTVSLGGAAFVRFGTSFSWNAVADQTATLPLDAQLGVLFTKDGLATGELAAGVVVPGVMSPFGGERPTLDTVAFGVSLSLFTRPNARAEAQSVR